MLSTGSLSRSPSLTLQFVHMSGFRGKFGGVLRALAPAAFLIPGIGPGAAAAIGGIGSAIGRGIQPGAKFGDIAKQGAIGAAIGYGGSRAMGALRGSFAPSSSPMQQMSQQLGLNKPSLASRVGKLMKDNPLVVGSIASGLLDARTQGQANDIARRQLELQQRAYGDREARRKRLQELLAPMLSSYAPSA